MGAFLCLTLLLLLLPWPTNADQFAWSYPDTVGHWAERELAVLTARGVIEGYPDGSFRPGRTLTRAEFAKMLVVALGYDRGVDVLAAVPSRFSDVREGHWAAGHIERAAELGLVEGYEDGTFRPERGVTRVEMAAMVVRVPGLAGGEVRPSLTEFAHAAEIPTWAGSYISQAVHEGLLIGFEDRTLRPARLTTRAEAVVLLYRLLEKRGELWDVRGEVVSAADGSVSLALPGYSRPLALPVAPDALLLRNGLPVGPTDLQPLDELVGVLGPEGELVYAEVSFQEVAGYLLELDGLLASYVTSDELRSTVALRPDVVVFRNGAAASLRDLRPGDRLYMVLDREGAARYLEAVTVDLSGRILGRGPQGLEVLTGEGESRTYQVAPGVVIYISGEPAAFGDLAPGQIIEAAALDDGGRILYLEVR